MTYFIGGAIIGFLFGYVLAVFMDPYRKFKDDPFWDKPLESDENDPRNNPTK